MNYVRNRYIPVVFSSAALLLAGCSAADEPADDSTAAESTASDVVDTHADDRDRAVRIIADASSTEQVLWAYIYRAVLGDEGRDAEVMLDDGADIAKRWDMLQTRQTDFLITCTGKFVAEFNPSIAQGLVADGDAPDPNEADVHEQFHREVMGLLPPTIVTTAPSSAQGCTDSDTSLPQDFTPLFGAGLFNREEIGEIQKVTRLLDDRNLEELEDKLADGLTAEEAAGQWAAVNVTGSSPDSVSDDS